ncbi:MAG: class I SAM-dependent methyltransferase [Pyrinomonadaceae bacterium]
MDINRAEHWEKVYATKSDAEVSWYREHLDNSLRMIINTGAGHDAAVIDVGGGSSTLVDDLLDNGFINVSVLDISSSALERSKARLGFREQLVEWISGDVTEIDLSPNRFDVWHDRAVFHFLTDPDDRRAYVELVNASVKPSGHIIVASFGTSGPLKCSGLDVVRYDPESMHGEFGSGFHLVDSIAETHETPFGTTQDFIYCYCRKSS